MFRLLVDTCVWLDLAKDPKHHGVLSALEQMVRSKTVQLLVPDIILVELQRNKDRVTKESARSLSSHFRLVREAVGKVGIDARRARTLMGLLDDVSSRLPRTSGAAEDAFNRIEKLLRAGVQLSASDAVKLRATERALDKRAPFHRDRNSMADALLIETYGDCVAISRDRNERFGFVTHNKADFSIEQGNHRVPHADISAMFSKIKSLYFISLFDALRRADRALMSDVMFEQTFDWEPRAFDEITKAEEYFTNILWHVRKFSLLDEIESGSLKVVDDGEGLNSARSTISRSTLDIVLRVMKDNEKRYGKETFGPFTDFQWGMINGKLSAIRWMMGHDWDMLDS